MSDDHRAQAHGEQPAAGRRGRAFLLYILAGAVTATAGFAAAFVSRDAEPPPVAAATGGLKALAAGEMTKLVFAAEPRPVPLVPFRNDRDEEKTVADWRGKVVLLNLWATWCGPCKAEMPTLDRLQARLGGEDFAVLAVSLDRDGMSAPRSFFESGNISHLDLLIDESGAYITAVRALGLPATLLIDREGREIARMLGPAEWDSEDAVTLIRAAFAAGRG